MTALKSTTGLSWCGAKVTTWKLGNKVIAKLFAPSAKQPKFSLELTYMKQSREYDNENEALRNLERFLETKAENEGRIVLCSIRG